METKETVDKIIKDYFENDNLIYTNQGRHGEGQFLEYSHGVFRNLCEDDLHDMLWKNFGISKKNARYEIIAVLGLEAGRMMRQKNIELNANKTLLNLKNCMYDLEEDITLPHNQKYFSTIQFTYDYDPEARCPHFVEFLKKVSNSDPQFVLLIQEWMGYLLSADTSQEKMLVLYGSGSNGKTTLIEVLQELIGEDNYTTTRLTNLWRGPNVMNLKGKLANFSDETIGRESGQVLDTTFLKDLITGGKIEGEAKFKSPEKFESLVRVIVSCNSLPRVTDTTYGWIRKMHILPFEYKFEEKDKIVNYSDKFLIPEMSGIFNFAIEGYKRLREQGWTTCDRVEQQMLLYQKENNSPAMFILEEYWLKEIYEIDYGEAYDEYKHWCGVNGLKYCSQRLFGERLENYFDNTKGISLEKKRGLHNQVTLYLSGTAQEAEEIFNELISCH